MPFNNYCNQTSNLNYMKAPYEQNQQQIFGKFTRNNENYFAGNNSTHGGEEDRGHGCDAQG
jgi:hypothetical protein